MHEYREQTDRIKALSDDEARAELADLATQLVGNDRWVTDIAQLLDVDRRTVQAWKAHQRPPTLALLCLWGLTTREAFKGFHGAFRSLLDATTQLGD